VELAVGVWVAQGVETNGTALSEARRNKYLMAMALGRQGLAIADQILSPSLADIMGWWHGRGGGKVVLKPFKSLGADSVYICENAAAIERSFALIHGSMNVAGIINDKVLAQEFLEGEEYIVNTVSSGGEHRVCEVWRCEKELISGAGYISCLEALVAPSGPIPAALEAYAKGALDALGIKTGPAHFEIMLTAHGPILIEVGARIQGAIHPASVSKATGTNLIELTIEAYLAKEKLQQRMKTPRQVMKPMYHLFLICPRSGTLKRFDSAFIEGLPSYTAMTARVRPGDAVKKTTDLFSSLGYVDLVHEDEELVRRDYRSLRSHEKGLMYEI
jgi:biotin carboxylase